jgi:ABC-type Fe3+-hydroxamate transport system substrate-binding protein
VPAVRAGRVLVVDTAIVGRPAVRLGEAATHLARLLHPELSL